MFDATFRKLIERFGVDRDKPNVTGCGLWGIPLDRWMIITVLSMHSSLYLLIFIGMVFLNIGCPRRKSDSFHDMFDIGDCESETVICTLDQGCHLRDPQPANVKDVRASVLH